MAVERNFTNADNWFLGEDKIFTFTPASAPQDTTGWTVRWMVKRNPTDADASALIDKAAANDNAGTFTVTLADTDTATLKAGTKYHELKRTDDGSETVLTFGTAVLRQGVQR